MIRQHTIGFILEQMNTLNPSMDTQGTEVWHCNCIAARIFTSCMHAMC
jgi:hypothetical protein